MTTDTNRAAFEAWAKDAFSRQHFPSAVCWRAWQAALQSQAAAEPDFREIADCVIANLDGRKGILNLDVDADIEEEIRQEVADTIKSMLVPQPDTQALLRQAMEALERERDLYVENDEDGAPEQLVEIIEAIRKVLP